ncbi:MAG: hypothetical protein ACREAC_18510, partial [Blastocatellia bacterium]
STCIAPQYVERQGEAYWTGGGYICRGTQPDIAKAHQASEPKRRSATWSGAAPIIVDILKYTGVPAK